MNKSLNSLAVAVPTSIVLQLKLGQAQNVKMEGESSEKAALLVTRSQLASS